MKGNLSNALDKGLLTAPQEPIQQPVENSVEVVENSSRLDVAAFIDSPKEAEASVAPAVSAPPSSTPEREPVRVLVVGTEHGINSIVHALYAKGFAHISEWSALLPHSAGKFMRILTRHVQRP